MDYTIEKHFLEFKRPARTSRNTFEGRQIQLVKLKDKEGRTGIGEAAPLKFLSIDDVEDYPQILEQKCAALCEGIDINALELDAYPSIRFGLETALMDLNSTGPLFKTPFTQKGRPIPINGLVWMDGSQQMLNEAMDKVEQGFNCIKFKVGALDFDEECRMLEQFRNMYSAFKVEIRLDANGAFKGDEALKQLYELKRFEVHSIEQPVAPKMPEEMSKLCFERPIDIALDEELIGLHPAVDAQYVVGIKPQYLILKPNLLGGLLISEEWVNLAQANGIEWWATSALESNVGLNAIAQWVSTHQLDLHQGLGTGALYKSNFESSLNIDSGSLYYSNSLTVNSE